MGFSDATRATAYSFTEFITVRSGGKSRTIVETQRGTLRFRSELTKRYIGTLPKADADIEVVLVGTYTLASKSIGCIIGGQVAGNSRPAKNGIWI
jgi:hypothetical protein